MPPMFRKSEEEKRYESKNKIRTYQNSIQRYLRTFENLKVQSINMAKKALAAKDMAAARNAARNIQRNELFIRYLRSFGLFIDNLQITMEYVYMERKAHQTLTEANKDLRANILSSEQVGQIQQSIDSIMDTTRDLEDRANIQLDTLDQSLASFANEKQEDVEKTLESLAAGSTGKVSSGSSGGSEEDRALDEILDRIAKEGEK